MKKQKGFGRRYRFLKQELIINPVSPFQIEQDQFVIQFKGRTYRASTVGVTLAPITSTEQAAVSSSMIGLIVAVVVFGLVLIIALVSVAVRKMVFLTEMKKIIKIFSSTAYIGAVNSYTTVTVVRLRLAMERHI